LDLHFVTVDVFTDRQFGGNPLAVILNAGGLSTGQMQSIAGEFNLAETSFVLPPKDAANTAHVRIFTPKAEMPFAGHPNVGTAFVLAREGQANGRPIAGSSMVFEEVAGLVQMETHGHGAMATGARLAAPKTLSIGDGPAPETIARACGLQFEDLELKNHAPCIASCGAAFVIAEVRTRSALASARPDAAIFSHNLPRERATGVHLYAHTPGDVVDIHTRMFAPLHGVPEDPATGSANAALIALLAKLDDARNTTLSLRIGQGFDMGRPSIMNASAVKKDGIVDRPLIGGDCVEVMRGTLKLR
jgi:trans-2,3-dihydro-3-hydroxyanthranilate isomerase